RRSRRRHLDPAPVPEGDVPALLEAELADVELGGPIRVGDGTPARPHPGDAGGPTHRFLLCPCRWSRLTRWSKLPSYSRHARVSVPRLVEEPVKYLILIY